jgi:HK97 family phage major capsid protein
MAKVSELKQQKVALLAEARSLLDSAEKESRSITSEESASYDELTGKIDAVEATIRVETDLEERQKNLARATVAQEKEEPSTESRTYDAAFAKYIRHGQSELSTEERMILRSGVESRAGEFIEGTPADGGYVVPTGFSGSLVNRLEQSSAVRTAGATILSTTGANPVLIPVVRTHNTASGPISELDAPDADTDTFDQVSLGAFKYGAKQVVSIELLQDSGVNLEAYLAGELGRKIGRAAGDAWATGAGTTEPLGLFTAATTTDTAVTNVVDSDDILTLIYSVEPQYRAGGSFIANDGIYAILRKLKWEISGDPVGYAWQPSMQAGSPDRLFGYPMFSEPSAPADVSVDGDVFITFGDVSRFYIRQVGGVGFLRLNEVYMADQMSIGFMAWIRTDSALVDENAVKALKVKT